MILYDPFVSGNPCKKASQTVPLISTALFLVLLADRADPESGTSASPSGLVTTVPMKGHSGGAVGP